MMRKGDKPGIIQSLLGLAIAGVGVKLATEPGAFWQSIILIILGMGIVKPDLVMDLAKIAASAIARRLNGNGSSGEPPAPRVEDVT